MKGVVHPPPEEREKARVSDCLSEVAERRRERTRLEVGSRVDALEPSSVRRCDLVSREEVRDRAGGERLSAGEARSVLDASLSRTAGRCAGRTLRDALAVAEFKVGVAGCRGIVPFVMGVRE